MKPDAIWHIATDSASYASWMREVLDNDSRFASEHPNGWARRCEGRPITQFEQRGLDAGRQIFDLAYRRVG